MPAPAPLLLQSDLDRFRADFLNIFPEAVEDLLFQEWAIAWEITAHFLGRDWCRKHLNPAAGNPYFHMTAPSDDPNAYLRQHRLIGLGQRLYELQGVPGFAEMTIAIRSRSLNGAVAELTTVAMLKNNGHSVRFVAPSGVKGHDYDAEASVHGVTAAIEVKAKEEQPVAQYRDQGIINTLGKARRQLPATGPGLIFLQIPPDWAADRPTRKRIDATVREWLRGSRRVNAVYLLFEQSVSVAPQGMAFVSSFDLIPSPRPRSRIRNVLGILRGPHVQGRVRIQSQGASPTFVTFGQCRGDSD